MTVSASFGITWRLDLFILWDWSIVCVCRLRIISYKVVKGRLKFNCHLIVPSYCPITRTGSYCYAAAEGSVRTDIYLHCIHVFLVGILVLGSYHKCLALYFYNTNSLGASEIKLLHFLSSCSLGLRLLSNIVKVGTEKLGALDVVPLV